jgi:hypothetical protein
MVAIMVSPPHGLVAHRTPSVFLEHKKVRLSVEEVRR